MVLYFKTKGGVINNNTEITGANLDGAGHTTTYDHSGN